MKHLLLAIIAAGSACLMLSGRKAIEADRRADAAYAAWLAIESETANAQEDPVKSLGLLDVASALYPADTDIAGSRARLRILMSQIEPNEVKELIKVLFADYYAHPEDVLLGKLDYKFIKYLAPDSVTITMARALHKNHPTDPELAIGYAQALADRNNEGDVDSALAIIDPILAAGVDPALSYYKAQIQSIKGDTAGMALTLQQLLADNPSDPERLYGIGSFYNYIHLPDSGYIYNVRACEVDSTYGPSQLAVAQYMLEQSDTTAAEGYLERALLTSSMDWEIKQQVLSTFLEMKSRHDNDKSHKEAFAFLDKLRRVHSTEPSVYMMRGVLYVMSDSVAQGIDDLTQVIDLDPENSQAYQLLGRIQAEHNDTVTGIATMMRGYEATADPTFAFNAAIWEMLINRPEKGLEHLDAIKDKSMLNKQGQAYFYNIKGDLYHALGRTDDAMAALDTAITYDPTAYNAYNNAAYYRAVAGKDLETAESYARIAVSGDMTNPTFLDTYAWVLFKRKDFQAARVQIDLALDYYAKSDTGAVAVAADTAWTDYESGIIEAVDVEEVIEESEDTPSADIYDHAGDIYFMVGEPAQALIFWQKALLLDPENKKIKKKVDNKTYFPDETI